MKALKSKAVSSGASSLVCEHCLLPVSAREAVYDERTENRKVFCCHACRSIYRMIIEEGLGAFYTKRDWNSSGLPEMLRGPRSLDTETPAVELEFLLPYIKGQSHSKEADLMIEGIRCASCVWLNEKILNRTKGVLSARINFSTHKLRVTWDSSATTLGRIISRLQSIGYVARPYTPAAQELIDNNEGRDLLIRLGAAAFFSMQLMMISFGLYAGFFQGIDPGAKRWLEAAAMLVCTPVLFYSGRRFFEGAFRGIKNLALNMDALISLGALSAYFLSIRNMLMNGEVYFDTSAMIITLVLFGRFLEHSAKRKASQAVSRLLALLPRQARIIRGNERILVSTSDVKRGARLEVRPGEKIPLDGIVRKGNSDVDESLVTGEAKPVEKSSGSEVIGGSMNGVGTLVIEVSRVGEETVLSQIAKLIENAQAAAAPIQRLGDRVSRYIIPVVIAAAFMTFLYWSRQIGTEKSVLNAVSVLVIACPCALGLAVPVALLAATGKAARSGILIKGGDIIERLQGIDTVIFDKTGTITTGKLEFVEIQGPGGGKQGPGSRGQGPGAGHQGQGEEVSEILQYAASAEQGSEHLVGKAIVSYAEAQGIERFPVDSFRALPGLGVSATINQAQVFVGKRALLEQEGIEPGPEIGLLADKLEFEGNTVVWVSHDKTVLGLIALRDLPRPEARTVVERLQKMKLDVRMISGDNQAASAAVADQTGISSVRASALPADKSEEILKLRREGRTILMI